MSEAKSKNRKSNTQSKESKAQKDNRYTNWLAKKVTRVQSMLRELAGFQTPFKSTAEFVAPVATNKL